jgi:magnesium transporter
MTKNGVVRASAPGCRWIDVQDPTEQVLAKLQRTYGFSRTNIEDILSPTQRPKLDVHEEYVFFVFRFPMLARGKRARATELDVILTHDTILTFHSSDLASVRDLLSDAHLFSNRRVSLLEQGPAHVLTAVLQSLFDQIYRVSDELAKQTDTLETQVFNPQIDRGVLINRIAQLRRRLLDYGKIAKPQATFLQYCLGNSSKFINHQEHTHWRSLIDTAEAQWELFSTSLDVVNGLAASNDSLTSHRFNQTVRLLTIISVIFLPAAFVLNILSTDTPGSPLRAREGSFIIVLGVLALVQASFLWFLRKRRVL